MRDAWRRQTLQNKKKLYFDCDGKLSSNHSSFLWPDGQTLKMTLLMFGTFVNVHYGLSQLGFISYFFFSSPVFKFILKPCCSLV